MHSTRYIPRALTFSALVISLVSGTSGQVVTGTLTGAVRDTTGATVPNARVSVTNQATASANPRLPLPTESTTCRIWGLAHTGSESKHKDSKSSRKTMFRSVSRALSESM